MSEEETQTWTGIMDAHGIESFYRKDQASEGQLFRSQMRASLNRQRHALIYEVELTKAQADIVMEMLNDGDYEGAAALLHDPNFVEEYGCEVDMMDSWPLLPNPALDPYHDSRWSQ